MDIGQFELWGRNINGRNSHYVCVFVCMWLCLCVRGCVSKCTLFGWLFLPVFARVCMSLCLFYIEVWYYGFLLAKWENVSLSNVKKSPQVPHSQSNLDQEHVYIFFCKPLITISVPVSSSLLDHVFCTICFFSTLRKKFPFFSILGSDPRTAMDIFLA